MSSSALANGHEKNKRRNAPLSCAECRRLKLRCSRIFPCASCVKKGCAAICPEGSLTTGKGNRFVLANTEVLHEKISTLSNRVRQLEDALATLYAEGGAQESHPLLTPELLQIKRPLEREPPEPAKEMEVDTAEAIDAVGSLSITESGHTKFFGTTANAWYLLQNEEGGNDETENPEITLPTDVPWISHVFPFAPTPGENRMDVRHFLLSSLPEVGQARHLVKIYYRHCGWMYTPIPEAELYSTVFSRMYDQTWPEDQDPNDSHRLAVLYMVFALGTLMDLDKPYLSIEATQYYQLARASLSLDSVLEHQSIPAIQALVLMCHFMFLSFRDGPRWALMGLVVKLAQSLGLHRDSGKWNLNPGEAFRRRSLMWEVYTYDSWQSLTFGRPPSFALAFIDCQMAETDAQPTTQGGEVEMSYAAWKHRFASRCLSVVHEQGFGARTANYKSIQDLDKKVRSFYVPPSLRVPGFGGAKMMELTPPSIELTMQRHIVFAIREITIFYLHRGFFARAIEDSPEDPLGSKFAPSVLAAYTSACTFVGLVKSLHSQQPQLTERHWFLFTHVFSCAIVLGSIAAKCPGLPFARSALMNLDSACSLFEIVRENDRAAKVLPVLQKLKSRAVLSMSNAPSSTSTYTSRMSPGGSTVKEEDEELAALGGKTRLVRTSPSQPSSPQDAVQQNTPSPKGSPIQPYISDRIPLLPAPGMHHANGIDSSASRWPPLTQTSGDMYYTPYPVNGQWSPDSEYAPMHSPTVPMGMGSMQYPAYEAMQPVANAFVPAHSPMESPLHVADPHASWQSLFAQFNQA